MAAYYNEIDPYCVAWLENLMQAGLVPEGDVDSRPIQEVRPDDLRGYDHCHFFAGLGGWALAARLAGYPEDRPLWTGSCPCQPFSCAGKRMAHADDRHLWPYWFPLIRECRPPVVFGEQVESKDGYEWLAGVQADLEGAAYAVAAACLPAACVASPQGRHRLWFVGYAEGSGWRWPRGASEAVSGPGQLEGSDCGGGAVANGECPGLEIRAGEPGDHDPQRPAAQRGGGVGDALGARDADPRPATPARAAPAVQGKDGERQRFWSDPWQSGDVDWLECAFDGKLRRIKPGVCFLADGIPARVAKLRALGNAIVPQVAAEFMRAALQSTN